MSQEQEEEKKSVAILAYSDGLVWHPSFSIQQGISGSEEAVMCMSQELVELGYKVVVYANPGTITQDIKKDNPCYLHSHRFVKDVREVTFDYIVLWRYIPSFLTDIKTRTGRNTHFFFWPHDFAVPGRIKENESLLSLSGIFFLSEWQRENYYEVFPFLMSIPYTICGNGLDPSHFIRDGGKKEEKLILNSGSSSSSWISYLLPPRKLSIDTCTGFWSTQTNMNPKSSSFLTRNRRTIPYSVIYASNYGRGLDLLLSVWPHVKDACPEARLSIYYGRQTWGTLSEIQLQQLIDKITRLETLGVTEYGKVGHRDVAQAFLKHSVWAYPCTYAETFCITAIKAAYAGCIPVVAKFAALHETVPLSAPFVNEIKSHQDLITFRDLLIHTLLESESPKMNKLRHEFHEWASTKTWSHTASRWVSFWNEI